MCLFTSSPILFFPNNNVFAVCVTACIVEEEPDKQQNWPREINKLLNCGVIKSFPKI